MKFSDSNSVSSSWSHFLISGELPPDFVPNPPQLRSKGIVKVGEEILNGHIAIQAENLRTSPDQLWKLARTSKTLNDNLQTFRWLDHLSSVGSRNALDLAQRLIQEWIVLYGKGKGEIWSLENTCNRLSIWVRNAWFLLQIRDSAFLKQFHSSMVRQSEYLRIKTPFVSSKSLNVQILTVRILVEFYLNNSDSKRKKLHEKLIKELTQLLNEINKSSEPRPVVLSKLCDEFASLIELNPILTPEIKNLAIQLGQKLNNLCHWDGSLVHLFGGNGSNPNNNIQNIGILIQGQYKNYPLTTTHGKLLKQSTSIFMSTINSPHKTENTLNKIFPAAMEIQSKGFFLCVNPGYHKDFADALQFKADFKSCHNTIRIKGSKPLRRKTNQMPTMEFLPSMLEPRLSQEGDFQSLTTTHENFLNFGYYHRREIQVDVSGETIIGTDTLIPNQTGIRTDLEYVIIFNFHPQVQPLIDERLNLQLSNGDIWELQFNGNGYFDWAEGIYLDLECYRYVSTQKLQLTHRTKGQETLHEWVFRKLHSTKKLAHSNKLLLEE